jgi:aspartyl-tRNA(Asn)/glutamyl-tRNA(Gln) amidotransferase subunit C
MPKLTAEDINQVAHLSRLGLSDKEKTMYAEQLSVVFNYMEILNEIDTSGTPETCQVTGLEDVYRKDTIINSSSTKKKKLVALFPDKVDDFLKVKNVF